jgi:hypothetical protein
MMKVSGCTTPTHGVWSYSANTLTQQSTGKLVAIKSVKLFSGDKTINCLVGVTISVIGSSEVDPNLNLRSDQTKD